MVPGAIAAVLEERGVDWIAITDHNTAGNVRAFTKVMNSVGIKVIPGIEVHTIEDVHILGFFPDIDTAESYSRWLYEKIPNAAVDPEVFGYQLLVNENDEFTAVEDKWLGQPTTLKIRDVAASILDAKGIFCFAHVERRMGVVYQLGFIPVLEMPTVVEISFQKTIQHIPQLMSLAMIHSSDAHSLNTLGPRMEIAAGTRTLSELHEALLNREERVRILWD